MAGAGALGRDLAIDLGTANTLVHQRGRGVVVDEPSVVAVNERSGRVLAVGAAAKQMIGRTPGYIVATRPLANGVISDIATAERMLRLFIQQAQRSRRFSRPRVVICAPSGLTGVERRAVREACLSAGARQVFLLEEPLAAAIGADLPVHEPVGSMIVDVGGGTTETAVISLGGMVTSRSTRVGGDQLDMAVAAHVKKEYGLAIGERTAEQIKIEIGSAFPGADEEVAAVRGRDLVSGLPKTVTVSAAEVRTAIADPVATIVDSVTATLDQCPPELSGDVMDRGIVLTGGGALLRGLDERLRHETAMPVMLTPDPLRCVVSGAGRCVEEFDTLRHVLLADAS